MKYFNFLFFVILIISLLFKSPFVTLLSILDLTVVCPIINGIFACIFLMVTLALKQEDTSFSLRYIYVFFSGMLISIVILVYLMPMVKSYNAELINNLSTIISVIVLEGLTINASTGQGAGNPVGNLGGNPGGNTGGNPVGNLGGNTGGNPVGNLGGNTGGNPGGNPGGNTGGSVPTHIPSVPEHYIPGASNQPAARDLAHHLQIEFNNKGGRGALSRRLVGNANNFFLGFLDEKHPDLYKKVMKSGAVTWSEMSNSHFIRECLRREP